ncbi:MAG TPA: aquaporin [Solirubrobacteraceae bacterium]
MIISRKLGVEFIGTFFLVFTVGVASKTAGSLAPLAIGAVLMVMIFAGGLAALIVIALNYDALTPIRTGPISSMLVVEFLFTFALAYVVLNVATSRGTGGNSFYGLAIGFTLVTGAFTVGPISGGAFNPAVAVGASLMGLFDWSHIWIYIVANLLGGAAAAAFRLTEPGERAGELRTAGTPERFGFSKDAA